MEIGSESSASFAFFSVSATDVSKTSLYTVALLLLLNRLKRLLLLPNEIGSSGERFVLCGIMYNKKMKQMEK